MSTIIDPINSNHLQANKLFEKCTAAYPILMLPLRLEARFMHIEPELTVNTSISDHTLTSIGNDSDRRSGANTLEHIDQAILSLVDKAKNLPKDWTVKSMKGFTAWKYAAASEVLALSSRHWLPRYRVLVTDLEQKNEALLQILSDFVLVEDREKRPLSSTQRDELSILGNQVLRALTEGDAVANTKADHFATVQEHLLKQLQQYRSLLQQYPKLHPEDAAPLLKRLQTIKEAVESWQSKAELHVEQFKQRGTVLKEHLNDVQGQLDSVYNTLSKEADYRLELPVWKGVVGIRGRLNHYHSTLERDDLLESSQLLTELQTYTQALLEPVGELEDPALFIHAQALLLGTDFTDLEARSMQRFSIKKAQLNHYYTSTNQLTEAIAPAMETLSINDRSNFRATALLGQLNIILGQLATLPATAADWTFAQISLHTHLHAFNQALRGVTDLPKADYYQLNQLWATTQERLSEWGTMVNQWMDAYSTQQDVVQNITRELQQQLESLDKEHLRNQKRAPLAQGWKAQHQWRLWLGRLLDTPMHTLSQQLDHLSTLQTYLEQSATSLKGLKITQTLSFALADNIGGSEAILDAFQSIRAGVMQAFEGHNLQLLDHQRRVRELKDDIPMNKEASMAVLEAEQPLLDYLYQRAATLSTKKITGISIDFLLYDQWQLYRILETVAVVLSHIEKVTAEGMNWLNNYESALNKAVQGRRQNIAEWLAVLEGQDEEIQQKTTTLRTALITQVETHLSASEQAPLLQLQRQAQRLDHLSAVLEAPLVHSLNILSLLEGLQGALDAFTAGDYSAIEATPAHKEALSKALQRARHQVQKVLTTKQLEAQTLNRQEHALAHRYQAMESVQDYVLSHRGKTELLESDASVLKATVQHLTQQLTQISAVSASVAHRSLQLETLQQSFQDLTDHLQQLAQRRLTESGQLTVQKELAPLAEIYEQSRSSLQEQHQELTTQAQAYEAQASNIHTQGKNGQNILAALAFGGNYNGYINDKTIICTFPIIPWTGGGSGGSGGGSGGSGGGDPDPDPTAASNYELWIRAYPDTIAINAHEQRLTDQEIADGIRYWSHAWRAADDESVELGAWRALVSNYGAERAAWIVRKMTPTNIGQRPVSVTIATTTIKDVLSMKESKLLDTGESFWNDIRTTQASLREQRQIIDNFKASHPEGKAEALSYLTYPERMGDVLLEVNYPSAPLEGLDANPKASRPSLRLAADLLQTRIERLQVQRSAVALTNPTPQFPILPPEERRDNTWSMAAYTDVMPDQLVFLLYNWEGEVAYEVMGNLIPEQLQIGLDPDNDQQFDPTQADLGIPSGTIKWLTNFEEAVGKGMAVKIPISTEEGAPAVEGSVIQPGFSRLYVLGIKHYDRGEVNTIVPNIEQRGQAQVADLLNAHHYTDGGLAILPPGTPTNNSSDAQSGFSAFSHDVQGSFQTEISTALPSTIHPTRPQDGHRLAQALGINSNVFKHIKNNQGHSSHNAEVVNKALWMSTWGLYLEEMFSHRDGFTNNKSMLPTSLTMSANHEFFSYFKFPEDLDKVYQFFVHHVKGRGALPSIRVGKQPYGILTTGLLQANNEGWRWDSTPTTGAVDGLNRTYLLQFQTLLLEYLWGYKAGNNTRNKKWLRVVEEKLRTVDDLPTSSGGVLTDLQEQFMTILRVHPTAASYYARYALNPYSISDNGFSNGDYEDVFRGSGVRLLNAWVQFSSDLANEFGPFLEYYTLSSPGNSISTSNTILNDLRLFETYGSDQTDTLQPLDGLVVDVEGPEPEQQSLSKIPNTSLNYIQWLRNTSPEELIARTKQPDDTFVQGGEPSNALLYLALRNALLNQYWDAAMRIFEKENLRDFTFKNFNYNGKNGWEALKAYNDVNANVTGTVFDPSKNLYASRLMRNDTLNVVRSFYNYGFVQRDNYKAFVKGTNNVLSNQAPQYGDQVILAGGRLPFLLEVTTADVGIALPTPITMAAYLFPGTGTLPVRALADYPAETAQLKSMLDALEVLAEQPVAELERLFGEHMDLASHRLDAWILGMANKRLQTIRAQEAMGTYLGSYGWLMDLQPGGQRRSLSQTPLTYTIDSEGQAPIMSDPDNQGYLQAPSLNHAMTGAVLRSGYEAHKGTADENLLAVNLSSERVRRALFYIEGVNNGQHLGALLGYRLERHFQEAQLAQYTLPFREAYPIEQLTYTDGGGQPLAPTSPGSVINGLALVEWLRAQEAPPAFNFVQTDDAPAVETALNKIVQDMDALADLALAEGTHQMVLGNYSRSNAMMRALAEGTTIPEPTIIETPRSSHTLTHRVGLTLPVLDPLTATPVWSTQLTQRALAEPALNAKLGQLLPNPAQVQCRVSYSRVLGNGAITEETTVLSLVDLNIEPIDLLYLFPERLDEQHSELAKRFHHAALVEAQTSFPAFAVYSFTADFEYDNVGGDYTVADVAPLLAQLKLLLVNSRYLRAADLIHPTTDTDGLELTGVHAASLQQFARRVTALRNTLEQAAQALPTNPTAAELWNLVAYGLNDIAPAAPTATTATALDYEGLAELAQTLIADRLSQYDQLIAPISTAPNLTTDEKITLYQKGASMLLGETFLMVPQMIPLNTQALQAAYADRGAILPAGDTMAVERWTAGAARVRRQINRLENVSFLQGLFLDYPTESLPLSPLQLPYRANDAWVGLELPTDYYEAHYNDPEPVSLDKLSLMMHWETPPSTGTMVGLLLDEWTETIPLAEETAGLAFHYDQPNAKPPQSILQVVHPHGSSNSIRWKWHQLVGALDTTLELAKMRAVEPDHLQTRAFAGVNYSAGTLPFDAFSQLLPATFALVAPTNSERSWSTDYHQNIDNHLYKND